MNDEEELKINLIDTHCHLDYDYGEKSTKDLVLEAQSAGVKTLITISTEMKTLGKVQAFSDKFNNIYHSVGIHPHEAETIKPGDIEKLKEASKHPSCVAIGEIGLDYYYDHSPRDIQIFVLNDQLNLAVEVKKPVVIHTRNAEDEMLKALTNFVSKKPKNLTPGVIHCFSGSYEFGKACLDMGFYLSVTGIITFKKAIEFQSIISKFPLERIFIETDAPFLAPVPYRGKTCEPKMVLHTAKKLADLFNVSLEEVARVTTQNAKKVFQIK